MSSCMETDYRQDDDLDSSEDSSSDSEEYASTEEAAVPLKPKQFRKYSGAAKYRTKFNSEWKFSFITSVSQDPYTGMLQ